MKTVAYYRRSTNIQENSIETQKQVALNKSIQCALPIDEEFTDDAISGRKTSKDDREELSKLLNEIKQGKVANLLVYKRDRLARNAIEYFEIYNEFKEKNLNVIFTAENEIPVNYSPAGELIELLMGGIIQREGEQIVERIQESIKANFQRKKIAGGNLPFGYDYDKPTKTISRNEQELNIVKLIFDEVLSEKWTSIKDLKDHLVTQNIQRNDKFWTVQAIKKLITNPTYMGTRILRISGETLTNKFEQLTVVDEADWVKAQDILERISEKREKVIKPEFHFPLLDLIYCEKCKELLCNKVKKQKDGYKAFYSCKNHCQINLEKTELEIKVFTRSKEFFKNLMNSHFSDLYHRYANENQTKIENNLFVLENEIKKLTEQLVNKTENWINEKRPDVKQVTIGKLFKVYDQLTDMKMLREQLINEQSLLTENHYKDGKQFFDNIEFEKQGLGPFYKDIIQKIEATPFSINIIFKHPFLIGKEVLEF